MGGKKETKTNQNYNQNQNQSTAFGSTGVANQYLDDFTAQWDAMNHGGYQGDVVAGPSDHSGRFTPQVNVLDNYVAQMGRDGWQGAAGVRNWARGTGGSNITDTATNLGNYWNDVSAGRYLDPSQNSALQNYMSTMFEQSDDALQRNLGQFRDEAIGSGAYGGTGYGQGTAWALDEHDQNTTAARNALLYQNYGDEMARIERSGAGQAGAFQLGMLPAQTQMQLGETIQGWHQDGINNEIARNLENERAAGADIQNNLMGEALDQQQRQAGLVNDASRWQSEQDATTRWGNFFGTLSNPVFGTNTSGTATGSSTSTTSQSTPAWQNIMGGISSAAQIAGALTGNPAIMAAGMAGKGMSGGQVTAPMGFMPGSGFSSMIPAQSSLPWYLQGNYGQGG